MESQGAPPVTPPPAAPDVELQEAHLWEYIYVVLRRRRMVLAVFIGVAALATLRSLLTRPVYEASAQILIERDTPNVLTFKEVAQVDAARDDYYQTQYKLLQSRALARRVIESMSLLQDPEYGGPRSPEELEAVKAAAPGASPLMEKAIDTFLNKLRVVPIKNSRLVLVAYESFRPEMAAAIKAACQKSGALLIADEVQCGLGRTGVPFYSSTLGLEPDLMSIGKALGGGVPVGAALISARVAAAVSFGDHGSTYGGNLLACRAALVFLDELTSGLLAHVAAIGPQIEAALKRVAARHSSVVEIRGAGVIWGLELDKPAAPVVEAALERGLLINRTADTVLRLLPPYIVDAAAVDQMAVVLDAALGAAEGENR